MKRNVKNKAKEIQCQWCKDMVSSYNLTNHIKFRHNNIGSVEDYVIEFGEFRKNRLDKKKGIRTISKVVCSICHEEYSIVGFHTHLRDKHDGLTPDDYVAAGYTEYRPKKIDYKKRSEKNDITCLICGICEFASHRHFADHVRIIHGMGMKMYAFKFIFKEHKQFCKCGCGIEVNLIGRPPYRITYVSGHNPNSMTGKHHKVESKEKMRRKAIRRGLNQSNKKNTKPELQFVTFLKKNNIGFEPQFPTEFGSIDFYLPALNIFVEIDGEYWHPEKMEYLNIQLLSSCISQYNREPMKNLIRIRANDVGKIETLDDLYKFNFKYDFNLTFKQVIIESGYFLQLALLKKQQAIPYIYKFLNTFQPEFPEIPTDEILSEIVEKIGKYDISKLKQSDFEFRNNSSNIGISYLKSNFRSYWKSSFKNQKSPIDAWKDPDIIKKVIQYRIGINDSGEIFDFTLHQIVRGLSAKRLTVSFFKPVLSAAIYYEFLKNKKNSVVLDPCAGFGGRLLGFKSKYPHGTYIGVEPNPETFKELQNLAGNFENVHLYNCKIEDLDVNALPEIDLSFTSIPYYDLETYSNPVEYESFDAWRSTFLQSIVNLPNLVLNVPKSLRSEFPKDCIEYKIISNTSHFDKSSDEKFEYLLKFK